MLEAHTGPSWTLGVTMVTGTENEKSVLKGRPWCACASKSKREVVVGISDSVCLLILCEDHKYSELNALLFWCWYEYFCILFADKAQTPPPPPHFLKYRLNDSPSNGLESLCCCSAVPAAT